MQDLWLEVAPGYSINQEGWVRNDETDKLLKRSFFENGEPAVSFRISGRLVRKQVTTLMAATWMAPHEYARFDTPMHLDGDRQNCHVDNLMFRPRWFVRRYHRECLENQFPQWDRPFKIVEWDQTFQTPWECARRHGFLQGDIMLAVMNQGFLFPGALSVEFV